MILSTTYRLILLTLLPLAAMLIYFDGQRYDPSLIRFTQSPASHDSHADFFPVRVGNLSRSGQIRSYSSDNLYEYVNGHAVYFISSGFIQLSVAEYSLKEQADPDIIVDIYDMGKAVQAFGILSDESGGKIQNIDAGLKGFSTPQGLSFIKDKYYVKISSYNRDVALDQFVEVLNRRMAVQGDDDSEFADFPDIGQVVTTRFIKEAYRGLDFLNNVMEREYRINDSSVYVFIQNTEKPDNSLALLKAYLTDSDIPFTQSMRNGKRVMNIDDPFEGKWVFISTNDKTRGVIGNYDENIINELLKFD